VIWIPLIFVPAVALSRDLAVVTLILGAFAIALRRDVNWRDEVFTNFRAPWTCVTAAFIFWSFLAVLWAPHLPLFAWLKVILALTATVILTTGLARLPINNITQLATPIISSAGTLFGLLLFERLTDGLLIRVARPLDASVEILNTLSGGLVLLCCVCFPVAWLLWRRTRIWFWLAAFVAACFALSLSYRMDAVPAGMLVGALSSLVVLQWHGRAFAVLIAIFGLVAFSWAPLAIGASAMHIDSWLMENIDRNWGYRIIIWHYVGELLRDHWLIGYGFDAARVVGAAADLMPERNGSSTFLHPHNGALQIWLELGLVGVILFAGAAALSVRRIMACAPSPSALAAAAGAFGFSATIWLLSYGIWQGWWLAVLGLTMSVVVVIFRIDSATKKNG
jgi:O-antigen ligase